MPKILTLLLIFVSVNAYSQQKTENLIIITTDGLRWQELFTGMDSAIANNPKFNEDDSATIYSNYWHPEGDERRKKLMPFMWSTMTSNGQIYGNRNAGNKVNNFNPYWFSFPGYSEFLTGFADTSINSNGHPPNPNVTILEYLNHMPRFKNKIAAFGAWDAFDRILNQERSGLPVMSAFDPTGGSAPTANEKLINRMLKDSYKPWGMAECLDVFTHYSALEWLKARKPRVMYIAYGETDEWAHSGKYRSYLDAAKQVDNWISELWNYIQSQPQYKNKTTLVITTDHGRGDLVKDEWTSHGNKIIGSSETWFAVIGPDTPVRGEEKGNMQFYQQQLAKTMTMLLGVNYKPVHPVADEILPVFKIKK